jgi:hypothetical protein
MMSLWWHVLFLTKYLVKGSKFPIVNPYLTK